MRVGAGSDRGGGAVRGVAGGGRAGGEMGTGRAVSVRGAGPTGGDVARTAFDGAGATRGAGVTDFAPATAGRAGVMDGARVADGAGLTDGARVTAGAAGTFDRGAELVGGRAGVVVWEVGAELGGR